MTGVQWGRVAEDWAGPMVAWTQRLDLWPWGVHVQTRPKLGSVLASRDDRVMILATWGTSGAYWENREVDPWATVPGVAEAPGAAEALILGDLVGYGHRG